MAQIEATHMPSPAVAETITELKEQKAKAELLPGIIPIWHGELRVMAIEEPSWAVDQLISKGGINLISGLPESHKSFITLEIVRATTLGVPFLGKFPTERCKALIVDEENRVGRSKMRLDFLSDEALDVAIVAEQHIKIDRPGVAEHIIKYCKANDIGVVVFDSLSSFHSAEENSNSQMAAVFEHFLRISQAGISVIIIVHEPKNSRNNPQNASARGAGDIAAKCDVHISMRHLGSDVNTILVTQLKNRDAEKLPEFTIAVHRETDRTWFEYVGEAPKQVGVPQRTDEAIIELLAADGELYQGQIFEALKVVEGIGGQKKIAERLKALSKTILHHRKADHGKSYYSLIAELPDE
ncbi:MAG TPA: AAA family ATPase [Candidatus Saccharimonadales bacterium]|nr:AAA family ATPase [Candidatus Saccharimonadales bacterium]